MTDYSTPVINVKAKKVYDKGNANRKNLGFALEGTFGTGFSKVFEIFGAKTLDPFKPTGTEAVIHKVENSTDLLMIAAAADEASAETAFTPLWAKYGKDKDSAPDYTSGEYTIETGTQVTYVKFKDITDLIACTDVNGGVGQLDPQKVQALLNRGPAPVVPVVQGRKSIAALKQDVGNELYKTAADSNEKATERSKAIRQIEEQRKAFVAEVYARSDMTAAQMRSQEDLKFAQNFTTIGKIMFLVNQSGATPIRQREPPLFSVEAFVSRIKKDLIPVTERSPHILSYYMEKPNNLFTCGRQVLSGAYIVMMFFARDRIPKRNEYLADGVTNTDHYGTKISWPTVSDAPLFNSMITTFQRTFADVDDLHQLQDFKTVIKVIQESIEILILNNNGNTNGHAVHTLSDDMFMGIASVIRRRVDAIDVALNKFFRHNVFSFDQRTRVKGAGYKGLTSLNNMFNLGLEFSSNAETNKATDVLWEGHVWTFLQSLCEGKKHVDDLPDGGKSEKEVKNNNNNNKVWGYPLKVLQDLKGVRESDIVPIGKHHRLSPAFYDGLSKDKKKANQIHPVLKNYREKHPSLVSHYAKKRNREDDDLNDQPGSAGDGNDDVTPMEGQ